jgi:hypothetical protein
MDLKIGQPACIVYQKDGSEPEERLVVPTYIPYPNVRAVSLDGLEIEEAEEMVELVREYQEYYASHIAQAFNFESWAEQTKNKAIAPKWRAFKMANIKDVK